MPPVLPSVTAPSQRSKEYGQGMLQQPLFSRCQGPTQQSGTFRGTNIMALSWDQRWRGLRSYTCSWSTHPTGLSGNWLVVVTATASFFKLQMDTNHTLHTLFFHPICCYSQLLLPDSKAEWNNSPWQSRTSTHLQQAWIYLSSTPFYFYLLQTFRSTHYLKCWHHFSSQFLFGVLGWDFFMLTICNLLF